MSEKHEHVALVDGGGKPVRSIIDGRKVCAFCGERFEDDPTSVDACIARMKADEAKTRERIASGVPLDLVPLEELEDEDLEAIVRCAKTGGNELAQAEAREAQNILDNRAESAHERSLSDYYGGGSPQTMDERHQAAWAEHWEAHRR